VERLGGPADLIPTGQTGPGTAGMSLPVLVWDGCACCEVEAALNVELDALFARSARLAYYNEPM